MVLLLGSIVTLVVAFTRDNVRRPREPDSGEVKVEKLEAAPYVAAVDAEARAGIGSRPPSARRAELERTLRIEWRWLVGFLLLVVLFVPPRRYAFPISLPFELDPYRLVVLGIVLLVLFTALSDSHFRFRASGLEAPLLLFSVAVAGSLAANPERFSVYESEVVKTLAVLVGFFVVFYLVVNLIRTREACQTALEILVLGGAVLAVLAVVEQKTGWSPFAGLDRYLPFLQSTGAAELQLIRDGSARTFGSAEHPIAFGALLVMLAPVAAALAVQTRKRIWMVCLALLVLGSFATGSRTAVLMLLSWGLLLLALSWSRDEALHSSRPCERCADQLRYAWHPRRARGQLPRSGRAPSSSRS